MKPGTPEDAELIAAYVRGGDVKSFSELVSRHSSWLTAFFLGMLGGEGEAEEALQELWLKVLKSAWRFRGGSVRAYLMRAARHVAYDRLDRRRRPVVTGRVDIDSVDPVDPAPGPPGRSETRELVARVRSALAALPLREREVVLMRVEGGLAYGAIAEELGVPLNTVHCWMHRARESLKRMTEGVTDGRRRT